MTSSASPTPALPAGRRGRNKADKRARILTAAQRLLDEVGYERMAMSRVAQDAGVAAGTVFQYAATKPELLMMVIEDTWRDAVTTSVRDLRPTGSVAADIMQLLEPLAAAARQHRENAMVVARELLFGTPGPHRARVVALVAELENAIVDLLVEAGAGERAPVAARLVVSGGVLELNRTRTGRADEDTTTERLAELVEVAVRGAGVPDVPLRRASDS